MGLTEREIQRLSPEARRQIMKKAEDARRQKETPQPQIGGKYHNVRTDVRGIRFDSKREAIRYEELLLRLKAGEIRDLKLQPEFTLQEAFRTPDGEKVRAIRYRADFSYVSAETGETVVEDAKGVRTDVYSLKRKLAAERGVTIVEV